MGRAMRCASRGSCVSMMKATDLRSRIDVTLLRLLNRAGHRRVSIKRLVSTELVVISEVILQDVHEMSLIERDHMVETFSPDGANQPFHILRLPWVSNCCADLLDPHALDAFLKCRTVDRVAIAKNVFGRLISWERFDDLLSSQS